METSKVFEFLQKIKKENKPDNLQQNKPTSKQKQIKDEIQLGNLSNSSREKQSVVESPRISMQSLKLVSSNNREQHLDQNKLTVCRNLSSSSGNYSPNESRYFDSRRNTFDRTSNLARSNFNLISIIISGLEIRKYFAPYIIIFD